MVDQRDVFISSEGYVGDVEAFFYQSSRKESGALLRATFL